MIGKRSTLAKDNKAREKDINEIIQHLFKYDRVGKPLNFAATNLNNVFHVPAGYRDELALRAELRDLKLKVEDLMSAYEEVNG